MPAINELEDIFRSEEEKAPESDATTGQSLQKRIIAYPNSNTPDKIGQIVKMIHEWNQYVNFECSYHKYALKATIGDNYPLELEMYVRSATDTVALVPLIQCSLDDDFDLACDTAIEILKALDKLALLVKGEY